MSGLYDRYGRKIDYLRISVTDRCNLRCIYCMPEWGIIPRSPQEILSFEEIERIAKESTNLGMNKIRITGGEPLIRRELAKLIRNLSKIEGISDLSMTTNGTLLKDYAQELRNSGLNRVNISLDTLNEEKYKFITRSGKLVETLRGIDEALQAGLSPVKINVVVMRGINDDEIVDFIKLTYDKPLSVRFIEFMPMGSKVFRDEERFIPAWEIKAHCQRFAQIEPFIDSSLTGLDQADSLPGNGPARYYRIRGALGAVGFISPLSSPFCSSCNRLRLISDGRLSPCLYSQYQIDLKRSLRQGASSEEIRNLIRLAISNKPKEHHYQSVAGQVMSQIGG
ncbi:GTP 3',8-cyclase MoaA [bacterium]|nr:GTP 3',8-cyclase MoaA [bacterium]